MRVSFGFVLVFFRYLKLDMCVYSFILIKVPILIDADRVF